MIIRSLHEMAVARGFDDPNFVSDKVTFWLELDDDGSGNLVPAFTDPESLPELSVPVPPNRTSAPMPRFCFDNAKYVLNIGEEGKKSPKQAETYAQFADELAQQTNDPGAIALSRFMQVRDKVRDKILSQKLIPKWTGSENIGIIYKPDGSRLDERPALREEFLRRRHKELTSEAPRGCAATGKTAFPARTHTQVKRVPGASATSSLSSVNEAAFESHEWQQGLVGPVDSTIAAVYANALNWMLSASPNEKEPFRQGVRLGDGMAAVFWTPSPHPFERDFLTLLNRPTKEAIQALRENATPDLTPFYVLILSGHQKRIAIRWFTETTVGTVRDNLLNWFDQLGRPASLFSVLDALVSGQSKKSMKTISPLGRTKLMEAIVTGSAFPYEMKDRTFRLLASPPEKTDNPQYLSRMRIRRALFRAIHARNTGETPDMGLDPNNTNTGYLLGRLFAHYDHIQNFGQKGQINRPLRDRFMTAAMQRPMETFKRLQKLNAAHLARVRRRWNSSATHLEDVIMSITDKLDPFDPFPASLNSKEQSQFILGFHHQRAFQRQVDAEMRQKRAEKGSSTEPSELSKDGED